MTFKEETRNFSNPGDLGSAKRVPAVTSERKFSGDSGSDSPIVFTVSQGFKSPVIVHYDLVALTGPRIL